MLSSNPRLMFCTVLNSLPLDLLPPNDYAKVNRNKFYCKTSFSPQIVSLTDSSKKLSINYEYFIFLSLSS